jgi:hypothetical protein
MEQLVSNFLEFILGKDFLVVAFFVIGAIEVFKMTLPKWSNSTALPYVALVLSFVGVYLANFGDMANWKTWILEGIAQAFLVDIFYTFAGKPLISAVKLAWSSFFKKVEKE